MGTARKILGSTVAQFAGKILVGLLSIVVIKLLTGYLTQEQYGEYNFIYDFLAVFGIIADLGLYTVAVREMSKDESKISLLLGNILTIRTGVAILAMSAAVGVGFLLPIFSPELAFSPVPKGIAIASITVLLAILNGTLTSVLQVKYRMRESAIALVIGKVISIVYIAYIVLLAFRSDASAGFYHVIAAGIVGNIAMFAYTWWYTRRLCPIRYRFDWKLIRDVFVKALPYGIALMLSTIYFRLNTLLLFHIKGSEEVAFYSVGMRIIESMTIISLYFMNSVLPVLTRASETSSGSRSSASAAHANAVSVGSPANEVSFSSRSRFPSPAPLSTIIQNAFDFLCMLGLAIVAGGIVLAYPIIAIVSDPQYLSRLADGVYGSDIGLQILLFALVFSFINTLFSFILISVNRQKNLLWINIGAIAVNLILNLVFIPRYGFRGAAITSVIAECYILVATFLSSKKYLKYELHMKNFWKILGSAVAMAVVVWLARDPLFTLMQNKNLIVLIPFGAAVYAASLWTTGVISREKIRTLFQKEQPEIVRGVE